MDDLLKDLNPEQRKAVTYGDGPLLIVAGAGTGKTTVLTRRLAWLILSGKAKPDEILAVTFTDKAAEEMEERVDRLLPYGYVDLWVSTFHAFCDRILKAHALEIGLSDEYKLLSSAEQWLLVRKNLDRFSLNYYRPLGNPTRFIHALIKHFSRAKDELISPEDYLEYAKKIALDKDLSPEQFDLNGIVDKEQYVTKIQEISEAYHTYQKILLENNALDFGDLIYYTLKLFQTRPNILNLYRNKFKYILVDEFQDTNFAQYQLIKLLAAPLNNLTVVGDDDQSIYRFRGASMSNILQFKKDYPQAQEIFINENYRSLKNILDLSYKFIQLNNPNRLEFQLAQNRSLLGEEKKLTKKLEAKRTGEGVIEYLHGQTGEEEALLVAQKILELKKNDKEATWNDFAVLVRANDYAEPFAKAFSLLQIPYQFIAAKGLYNKGVVLDIIAYLKLLDNYHESSALWRVLNFPFWQISNQALSNLTYWANRRNWSFYETMRQAPLLNIFEAEDLKKFETILNLIEKHTNLAKNFPPSVVIYTFLEESGYLKYLNQEETQKNFEDLNFLNQFYKKVKKFEEDFVDANLKSFLDFLDLEIQAGDSGSLDIDLESGPEAVKILTIHGAKGLEWKYVFITNLVDRRFPSVKRAEPIELPKELTKEIIFSGDEHLEEERRLFYVAMTRARDGLFFTSAEEYGGSRRRKVSRFLQELGLVPLETKLNIHFLGRNTTEAKRQETQKLPTNFKIPEKFSYTQLKAFETCPLQYKFAHILRIPTKGRPSFSFGQTLHRTLAKLFLLVKERASAKQGSLFLPEGDPKIQEVKISLDEALKIYEDSWIDDWYFSRQTKEEYFKKGKDILKKIFEENKGIFYPALFIEQPFNLKIQDITLKGVIDRVDQIGDDIEVIDYKTGSSKDEEEIDKDQLTLYQIAMEEIFHKKPKKLTYFFLETGDKVSFLAEEKEKTELKQKIVQVYQEIQKSDFPPSPGEFKCRFCDFQGICEYKVL